MQGGGVEKKAASIAANKVTAVITWRGLENVDNVGGESPLWHTGVLIKSGSV